MTTHTAYLALPAVAFILLTGGMIVSTLVALARTSPINRLARAAVWNACKAGLTRVVRFAVSIITAGVALTLLLAIVKVELAAAQAGGNAPPAMAITKSIERITGILDRAAKHPLAQTASMIARGYTAVKVYRLSNEVKGLKTDVVALQVAVHGVLTEVTMLIERVEAGEVLTAEQISVVNGRVDVHALLISAVEVEIEVLKHRMDEADRRQRDADRLQMKADRRQRELDRRLQEADRRLVETESRQQSTDKRMRRNSRQPYLYFDPKSGRRLDVRDRDGAGGLHSIRTVQN
jgi:hypothetical protein